MSNLLITLLLGVVSIIILFFILLKGIKLSRVTASITTLVLVCVVYFPLLLIDWPGPDVMAIQIAIYGLTIYILSLYAGRVSDKTVQKKWYQGYNWVPYAIIGFFVLLATADIIFITLAQKGLDASTADKLLPKPRSGANVESYFTGAVKHDYQEKQDEFNDYKARRDAQLRRGWVVKKGWINEAYAKQPAEFQVQVLDAKGKPVTQARIVVQFLRNANPALDQTHELKELEHGKYKISMTLPEPGRWDVLIHIKKDKLQHEVRAHTLIKLK